jgi:four helix bundle protein
MGNISEGSVRRSNKEFVQFLFVSISSTAELQSHFYVALDHKYVTKEAFDKIYEQAAKVAKMVSNLITYLLTNIRRLKQTRETR